MHTLGSVLLISIFVGAFIGALTNLIAITMLFRPFRAIKIWKWRLPFTPGMIPRRQPEIAYQLGQVVAKHLVTKDALEEYLNSPLIQEQLRDFLGQAAHGLLERVKQTKVGYLSEKVGLESEELAHKGVTELTLRIKRLVQSAEGARLLYQFAQSAIEKQGTFRRMLDMLLPKDKLTSKLQMMIIDNLENGLFREWLYAYLYQELRKLEEQTVAEILGTEQEQRLMDQLPLLLDQFLHLMTKEAVQLLEKINIAEIVEKQILAYPLPQLEKLILDVVKKELKMITLFGGVLGGLLGMIQVVIFRLMSLI